MILLMEPTVAFRAPHTEGCRYSPFSSRYWRPQKLGCSKNTQDPSRTLQDWTSRLGQFSWKVFMFSVNSRDCPSKFGRSNSFSLHGPLAWNQISHNIITCVTKKLCSSSSFFLLWHLATYVFDDPAGSDTVIEAHPVVEVIVFPRTYNVLVACEVAALKHHPPASLYLDWVTSVDVAVQVDWVPFAFIGLSLEVLVLEKHNLERRETDQIIHLNK